jgi:hypothetical protein
MWLERRYNRKASRSHKHRKNTNDEVAAMHEEHHDANAYEDDEQDDLEVFIAECMKENPDFPALLEEAGQRRIAMVARGEDPNGPPDMNRSEESQDETPQSPSPGATRCARSGSAVPERPATRS